MNLYLHRSRSPWSAGVRAGFRGDAFRGLFLRVSSHSSFECLEFPLVCLVPLACRPYTLVMWLVGFSLVFLPLSFLPGRMWRASFISCNHSPGTLLHSPLTVRGSQMCSFLSPACITLYVQRSSKRHYFKVYRIALHGFLKV